MNNSSLNNPAKGGVGMPSYNNYIDAGTPFTAPEDGLFIVSFYHSSDGSNTLTLVINGVTMGGFQSHDYDNQNIIIPLKKGDVVTSSGANIRFRKFCGNR